MNGHRNGFAMITAIVLMGLCGMTMTALSAAAYIEATRTQTNADAAQLRQLLTAGAVIAVEKAESNSTGRFDVQLPESLRENAARLSVTIQSGSSETERVAEIDASLPRYQMSQKLRISVDGGVWHIAEAQFGG